MVSRKEVLRKHLTGTSSLQYDIAQMNIADMYRNAHQGVSERDDVEAMRWYKRAAIENGNNEAMHKVGDMYYFGGQGIDQNYKEALSWCKKAGNNEYALAQHDVEHMYKNGYGTTQDFKKSIKW